MRVCAGKAQRCIMDPLCDVEPVPPGRSIALTSQRRLTRKLVFPVTHKILLSGLAAFQRAPARLVSSPRARGGVRITNNGWIILKRSPQCRSEPP
jgi:hypothetical protein